MQVWLSTDGRPRGVASLDAITEEEFADAFTRWPVSLKKIEDADLDRAIYAAIEPDVVVCPSGFFGYQAVRLTLKAQKPTAVRQPITKAVPEPVRKAAFIEPMPVLI
jgi:hypothetical protein